MLVEVMVEREDDAAMGKAIDAIKEFEAVEGEVPDPLAAEPELAG